MIMRTMTILACFFAAGVVHAQQQPASKPAGPSQAAGHSFRDCRDCPEMVPIPPGQYTMGASLEEETREGVGDGLKGRGQPTHPVTIARGFALGKYPITRGQYAKFTADTGYLTREYCTVYSNTGEKYEWKRRDGYSWRNPNYPQKDREPVVCVSWEDARAYADWLSRKSGKTYRLPSEAEWEYAARAGSQTVRPWGDAREKVCSYANTADRMFTSKPVFSEPQALQCSDRFAYTSPVGSFRANAFGLYDMLGNAWQWVEDCFNANHQGAPDDGSARESGSCEMRVHKGGAWTFVPSFVRSGQRMRDELERHDARGGFRVARSTGPDGR